ncbi:metal tolerance protein C2, putative [Entamoeba invadens IP1]|uniref:Metal tolerance protein C2, putative n=1 Tax=Entamoeba invadens IP1 TaxID=370355 RepID=A0A0A1U8Z9_ENTIV|nr:metal tolerance protein C2, putative [Entamoeba invadens IP1]ELP91380.1 metal tolerance protein C2, putative [Entamoeba invadens IP1]|eukprot:XP_004258151.1 metal tolerance protein C2, putative [Entamoeba invadens IP1]
MFPSPVPLFQSVLCLLCITPQYIVYPWLVFLVISLMTFINSFNLNNYKILFTQSGRDVLIHLVHFVLSTLSIMICPATGLMTLLPVHSTPLLVTHVALHITTLSLRSVVPLVTLPLQYFIRDKQYSPIYQSFILLPISLVLFFIKFNTMDTPLLTIPSVLVPLLLLIPASCSNKYIYVFTCMTILVSFFFGKTTLLPLVPNLLLFYFSSTPTTDTELFAVGGASGMNRISIRLRVLFTRGLEETLSDHKSRKLFYYFLINLLFMFVEVAYGWWSGSLGLISDGFHMLFDCVALAMGLVASVISRWMPDRLFTYGYARAETLSGFVNALFLVYIAFFVFLESVHRLMHPADIKVDALLIVSVLGLLVNIIGVFAFRDNGEEDEQECDCPAQLVKPKRKKGKDNNMEGIFLHVLSDTLGSVGVIVSSFLVEKFGWVIADPICSLCLSGMIFFSVMPLLKNSANLLLQNTPKCFDVEEIQNKILKVEGVSEVVKLNAWEFAEESMVATAVVKMKVECDAEKIRSDVYAILKEEEFNSITVELVI